MGSPDNYAHPEPEHTRIVRPMKEVNIPPIRRPVRKRNASPLQDLRPLPSLEVEKEEARGVYGRGGNVLSIVRPVGRKEPPGSGQQSVRPGIASQLAVASARARSRARPCAAASRAGFPKKLRVPPSSASSDSTSRRSASSPAQAWARNCARSLPCRSRASWYTRSIFSQRPRSIVPTEVALPLFRSYVPGACKSTRSATARCSWGARARKGAIRRCDHALVLSSRVLFTDLRWLAGWRGAKACDRQACNTWRVPPHTGEFSVDDQRGGLVRFRGVPLRRGAGAG